MSPNSHRVVRRKLTPKQRVLKRYPNAEYCHTCNCIHKENGSGNLSGLYSEKEMWANAARRLK